MRTQNKMTVLSVLVFALVLFLSFGALAQGSGGGSSGDTSSAVGLPMIRSQDALRSYALSIARIGSRNVQSDSMDWSWTGSKTYTTAEGGKG